MSGATTAINPAKFPSDGNYKHVRVASNMSRAKRVMNSREAQLRREKSSTLGLSLSLIASSNASDLAGPRSPARKKKNGRWFNKKNTTTWFCQRPKGLSKGCKSSNLRLSVWLEVRKQTAVPRRAAAQTRFAVSNRAHHRRPIRKEHARSNP